MTEWKVFGTLVGPGERIYRVYRIKNPKEAWTPENIETTGNVYDNRVQAQAEADRLNGR